MSGAEGASLDAVDISVVIPVYNEEAAIEHSLAAIAEQLQKTGKSYEIVCVDDGSRDGTLKILEDASQVDGRIKLLPLARNFGKESAMAAGLMEACGRAVLLIDADLQHPPNLIPRMIGLWDEGYDVVSATKEARAKESLLYRAMTGIFNRLMGGAAGGRFQGASDFKLLDRQVVDALASCPEKNRFFRGLVTWVGFRTVDIPFRVQERIAGTTKWSLIGLVRYSLRNLIAFTALPLKMVAALGFGTLVFSAGLAVQTLWRYLSGQALSGFTTVILLQIILGGIVLAGIGVVALYVAEIYDEVKGRPIFLVRRPRNNAELLPGESRESIGGSQAPRERAQKE